MREGNLIDESNSNKLLQFNFKGPCLLRYEILITEIASILRYKKPSHIFYYINSDNTIARYILGKCYATADNEQKFSINDDLPNTLKSFCNVNQIYPKYTVIFINSIVQTKRGIGSPIYNTTITYNPVYIDENVIEPVVKFRRLYA